jgi:hypothetical protein
MSSNLKYEGIPSTQGQKPLLIHYDDKCDKKLSRRLVEGIEKVRIGFGWSILSFDSMESDEQGSRLLGARMHRNSRDGLKTISSFLPKIVMRQIKKKSRQLGILQKTRSTRLVLRLHGMSPAPKPDEYHSKIDRRDLNRCQFA